METKTNTQKTPLLAWSAPTKVTHERSEKWYVAGGLLCATFIAYGVLTGEWALAVVCGLLGGLYFLTRNDTHGDHTIAIYEEGVVFDEKNIPWGDLKEFWILEGRGYHELHIGAAKYWKADLVIQTGTVDPYTVRDTIGKFIPQTLQKKEKFLDALIRFAKL